MQFNGLRAYGPNFFRTDPVAAILYVLLRCGHSLWEFLHAAAILTQCRLINCWAKEGSVKAIIVSGMFLPALAFAADDEAAVSHVF